jgi:chaperonin GroEL
MKHYAKGQELQQKLSKGVDILADNVCSTLGPKGRNVILKGREGNPIITKDGVTIANFIDLEDPVENLAAQIVKQAASKTNQVAGDGTTTSTVLTRAIYKKALKYVNSGAAPVDLKRGMDKARGDIVDIIKQNATKVSSMENLKHVATISANGDKVIGDLLATAIEQAGVDGGIKIEDAKSSQTTLEMVEGFIFDSGFVSPRFVNDERRNAVNYDNPMFFITDHKLEHVEPLLPILELAARESKPLVIIADEVEGQFLASLIMNSVRGSMKVAAVKAPRYGEERREIMSDIALATGGVFFTKESGRDFSTFKLKEFGTAKSVDVSKLSTTIIGGNADYTALEERIEILKTRIKEDDDLQECKKMQERINRLVSAVAIIKVGAPTEVEMIEKKHRIEDALGAVTAAQKHGFHAGGGVGLLRASEDAEGDSEVLEDEQLGYKIVVDACSEPFRQISRNCGLSEDVLIQTVLEQEERDTGYNFATNELCNLIEEGVIDPVLVTSVALENSVSVAGTLITTNYAVVDHE